MGVLFNGAQRSGLKPGDHIYTWRGVYTYSHHGIYMGGDKVVHFTQQPLGFGVSLNTSVPSSIVLSNMSSLDSCGSSFNSFGLGSTLESSCSNYPYCGIKNLNSGVVLSCLDCFLGSGSLYLFEYGVTRTIFLGQVRGGTCTTAKCDPTDMVIHRAVYLLIKGFGNYDLILNNCEDFALYCKTSLVTPAKLRMGRSGQAASVLGAPVAAVLGVPVTAVLATTLRFFIAGPVGIAVTAGIHCASRYATDIGVRSDVIKVAVEDLGWVHNPGKEVAEEVSKREMPNHGLIGFSSNPKQKKSRGRQHIQKIRGVLFNGAQRSDLKPGDHIYTYRCVYTCSHHGIYIGGDKVVHFTQEPDESSGFGASFNTSMPSSNVSSFNSFGSGSNHASSCSNYPYCGIKSLNSGVVLSCIDCFLGSGSLYLFKYGVTRTIFLAQVRGGTCTMANSDPMEMVIDRALYLLKMGFGSYDILLNNCEDFALYCKTGLVAPAKSGMGRSGQAASVHGAKLARRFLKPTPVGISVAAGVYCVSRYVTDIGVRSDVTKVAVEDLGWVHNPGKEAAEEVSKREMPNHGLIGYSSDPKQKKSRERQGIQKIWGVLFNGAQRSGPGSSSNPKQKNKND